MAQLKDLLVDGKSRFIDKIYASDQFISKVAQGTSPLVVDSSTIVTNLNADLVDGQHFTYSNTNNTPTYLWGTSANGTSYLVSRANMHMGISDKITTIKNDNGSWFYLTFVDSNNDSSTEENLYTNSKLLFNPSNTGFLIVRNSVVIGSYDDAESGLTNYLSVGIDNDIYSSASLVVGDNARAHGYGSFSQGYDTDSSGAYSFASGYVTIADGSCSHAEGNNVKAYHNSTHAEGYSTTARGQGSHAEGYSTYINEGSNTPNTSQCSIGVHVEGYGSYAGSSYNYNYHYGSHAEGYYGRVSGSSNSYGGHAEGYWTMVYSGNGAHAEGYYTTAQSSGCHSEGYYTNASGTGAHSEGYYTRAYDLGEHAEGMYNISRSTIHTTGIGSDENNRKNALEIKRDGKMYVLNVGGFDGQDDMGNTLQVHLNTRPIQENEWTYIFGGEMDITGDILYIYLDDIYGGYQDPEDFAIDAVNGNVDGYNMYTNAHKFADTNETLSYGGTDYLIFWDINGDDYDDKYPSNYIYRMLLDPNVDTYNAIYTASMYAGGEGYYRFTAFDPDSDSVYLDDTHNWWREVVYVQQISS